MAASAGRQGAIAGASMPRSDHGIRRAMRAAWRSARGSRVTTSPKKPIDRVREVRLALPEAFEQKAKAPRSRVGLS